MKKLCTISHSGPIVELGGIRGPVTRPMEIDTTVITKLVNRGVTVYEVNPYKRSEKVKLTYANIMTVNFEKVIGRPAAAPATHNPFKLPEGRRTTVVEESSEVKIVAAKKQQKKNEKDGSNAVAVTSSDF